MKSQYRKFNIKSADLTPGDDYAMMREVLTRRFKRLVLDEADASGSDPYATRHPGPERREPTASSAPSRDLVRVPTRYIEVPDSLGACLDFRDDGCSPSASSAASADRAAAPMRWQCRASCAPDAAGARRDRRHEEFPDRPDLVLIDGGLGQLGVAREVLARARHRRRGADRRRQGPGPRRRPRAFPSCPAAQPMMLEPRDPVLYFVQRLRDEAHRFAIGTHRAKRTKAIGANPLDEIAGHRSAAQTRAARAFRLGQGRVARRHRRSGGCRRHQRADGAGHLRFLPRAARLSVSNAQVLIIFAQVSGIDAQGLEMLLSGR